MGVKLGFKSLYDRFPVRSRTSLVAVIAILFLGLAGCTSAPHSSGTTSTSAEQDHASTTTAGGRGYSTGSIVAQPDGFVAEKLVDGGPTGSVDFAAAGSAVCSIGPVSQSEWVKSEVGYYDRDPKYPGMSVQICVTELASTSIARSSVKHATDVLAIPSAPSHAVVYDAAGIPGSFMLELKASNGSDEYNELSFSRGRYFVFLVVGSLAVPNDSLSLTKSIGQQEFLKLPS